MIYSGRTSAFVMLILICAIAYWRLLRTGKGAMPKIRQLPALDAIEESIGRAAEMSKPVFFNSGYSAGGFTTIEAPIIGASMSLLSHTARLCARYGTQLVSFLGPIDMVPVTLDVIKTAYTTEGKAEDFKETMVRWLSDQQFVYTSGFMGACQRERPASHVMMGGFWYESILLGEAGRSVGAMTVGGTPRQGQVYFLVAICDYVLIGDEYYAAASSITKDPGEMSSIWAADDIKILIIALTVVGSVLGAIGVKWIQTLLTM